MNLGDTPTYKHGHEGKARKTQPGARNKATLAHQPREGAQGVEVSVPPAQAACEAPVTQVQTHDACSAAALPTGSLSRGRECRTSAGLSATAWLPGF